MRHIAVFLRREGSGGLEVAASGRPLREVEVRREEMEAFRLGRAIVQEAYRTLPATGDSERFYDIAEPLQGTLPDGAPEILLERCTRRPAAAATSTRFTRFRQEAICSRGFISVTSWFRRSDMEFLRPAIV